MVIRFLPKDEELDECEIRVVGPVMEELPDLDREELALALEAALNESGFLFLDRDEHLWWVQSSDEHTAGGAAITFTRQSDELGYPGPLPSPAGELTEDELLGRVIG